MKSFTLDDVYHDYDRKNKIKISSDMQGDNKISKTMMLYNPRRKIKKTIIDNLAVKHYIIIGETCPICYENIDNRKNAYLTDCGHVFHYSCIINYDYCISKNNLNNHSICCPSCRQYMGNYNYIKDKYNYSRNEIDKLDDFEMNIKIMVPTVCFNYHQFKYNNHFHIMKFNNCIYCRT